jgi:hypothetical protein
MPACKDRFVSRTHAMLKCVSLARPMPCLNAISLQSPAHIPTHSLESNASDLRRPSKHHRTHFAWPIPAILSTLSASPIATTPPATIDAMTLSEVIILTNPIPILGPILPSWTHSLTHRSDPSITHSLATRSQGWVTLCTTTGSVSIGGAGRQGISYLATGRWRWWATPHSRDCRQNP